MTLPQRIGHFDIKDKLGIGGMGTVFLAHDPRLNRDVAIKVMHEHLGLHDQFRVRFAREAQAIAALDHPHIIKIFYADADNGRPYLVMEYFQDGSLREYLNALAQHDKLLSVYEVVRLVMQIAAALDYAHQKNMIHRDVKPDNVLLKSSRDLDTNADQFSAVLSDFGLVKVMEGANLQSQAIPQGTFPYMAPEQFTGQETDHRTDIYALGMMFYELLTGHLPFRSKSPMEVARMHIEREPPPLHNARPNILPELEQVVLKCIAKHSDRRFQSGKDLIKALRSLPIDANVNTTLDDMDTVVDSVGRLERLMTYLAPPTAVEPSPVPFNLGAGLSTNISISSNHLVLNAGERDEMRVVVHNRNSTPETYRLIVSGVADEWVAVNNPQLTVPSGKSDEFTIHVHPPRRSWSRAGHHRINFQIINREEVVIAEASGMITIYPFHELLADLRPNILRPNNSDHVGNVVVSLQNRGNTAQEVNISAHDTDAALTFSPPTTKINVDPGGQQNVSLRVGLRDELDGLGHERLAYTVTIRPQDGEILTLSGKVVNTKTAPERAVTILSRTDAQRLFFLTELTWGLLAIILFGWLFLVMDVALTSPQFLDRPSTVHPTWALILPEDKAIRMVMLVLAIGLASTLLAVLKQRMNALQNKNMTFWWDTVFAGLFSFAFIALVLLASEGFSSVLNWSTEEGQGVTPAAILIAISLVLLAFVALKTFLTAKVRTARR